MTNNLVNAIIPQMNLESRIYPSPSSAPLPGGESPSQNADKVSITPHDLLEMNGDQLFDYVINDLAQAELEMYSESPDAESKLIFLCGDPINNPDDNSISTARTIKGDPIYREQPKLRKISEIDEWIGVAGRVLHEGGDMADLVSESADLFYNLARLSSLDTNKNHPHVPNYDYIMSQIAGSLGWSKKEAMLVAASKYYGRLIKLKRKDPAAEKQTMEDLLRLDSFSIDAKARVSTPTEDQINNTWGLLGKIRRTTLFPRRDQIIEGYVNKQNGHVYAPW